MADYSTEICTAYANAPQVTNKTARCQVCHTQWQIRSFASPPTDALGCRFCDAPASAITIVSEAPDYGGAIIT